MKNVLRPLPVFVAAGLILAACAPSSYGLSLSAAAFGVTARTTPTPTATPIPIPTAIPMPYDPPPATGLVSGVAPVQYLADKCDYLSRRWNPENAEPGTIVAPVMFHSVTQPGRAIPSSDHTSMTAEAFAQFMQHAHRLGFETITATQLVNFLERNAKIPPRSMILIVDDRRPGVVREHFLPFLKQYNWTVTLGYITGVVEPPEWQELAALAATGRIDVQAHGFLHNGSTYITDHTPEETTLREIYAPIPAIRQHFGSDPVAFVWPGGDFNTRAVQIARQAHYRIGFTVFARGPLAFNWIPLGAQERAVADPLLVLPRYWSPSAFPALDDAARIGAEQAAYAAAHKDEEQRWMQTNCP
ncbi:MAG TPA: polysaccharide deacetylase family protein [Anaerolineaceae bacterium]